MTRWWLELGQKDLDTAADTDRDAEGQKHGQERSREVGH